MPEAQIADDAAKARFRVEGRQLYNPPINPRHNPFPEDDAVFPGGVMRGQLYPLTPQQKADLDDMLHEGDKRRAAISNVEEMERSIALCQRALGKVPGWMIMARQMLREQRRQKYGSLGTSPEA